MSIVAVIRLLERHRNEPNNTCERRQRVEKTADNIVFEVRVNGLTRMDGRNDNLQYINSYNIIIIS